MDHPRIAAVVSAVAASAAAFSVVNHWRLAGTLIGAALVPVICMLVSPWSSVGIERMVRWLQVRIGRGGAALEGGAQAGAGVFAVRADANGFGSHAGGRAEHRAGDRRPQPRTQWLLIASTVAALAFSVYSVASSPAQKTVERVVVEKVVVEKTVTVTTEAGEELGSGSDNTGSAAEGSTGGGPTADGTATGGTGTDDSPVDTGVGTGTGDDSAAGSDGTAETGTGDTTGTGNTGTGGTADTGGAGTGGAQPDGSGGTGPSTSVVPSTDGSSSSTETTAPGE
jgi:hypothetical protein